MTDAVSRPRQLTATDALKVVVVVGVFATPLLDAIWVALFTPWWWPSRLLAYVVLVVTLLWDPVLGFLLCLWAMAVVVLLRRQEITKHERPTR
ncbi:MAG: hypothetical protein ABEI52_08065 [Halobacteriaceae archaeon]